MERLDLAALRVELEESEGAKGLFELGDRILKDLARIYAADDAQKKVSHKAQSMSMLRGSSFWLSEAEALRMYEHVEAGGKIEHEKGVCRKCRGESWTMGRSHCFGHENDTCTVCDGCRIDSHRVKVPGADTAECKCPDWWAEHNSLMGMDKVGSPLAGFEGLKHHENCPKRTA
jgi:hypothetical protein